MVGSDYKAEDCDRYYCSDYTSISECVLFSCVEGNNAGDNAKSRENQNVDFWMAKESEQVLE